MKRARLGALLTLLLVALPSCDSSRGRVDSRTEVGYGRSDHRYDNHRRSSHHLRHGDHPHDYGRHRGHYYYDSAWYPHEPSRHGSHYYHDGSWFELRISDR